MKINPANELKKLMNGHTQEQIAEILDVSQSEISHCLTGSRPTSKALLAKLGLECKVKREYVRVGNRGLQGPDGKPRSNRRD